MNPTIESATVTAVLRDGRRYALTVTNRDGRKVATHGTYDADADCFWYAGHAGSLPGRGDARLMRENSLTYAVGNVIFVGVAKF